MSESAGEVVGMRGMPVAWLGGWASLRAMHTRADTVVRCAAAGHMCFPTARGGTSVVAPAAATPCAAGDHARTATMAAAADT